MKLYKREYSVDELKNLYLDKNLTAQEIANIYNLPRYIIERDLKKNNIHKTEELVRALRTKEINKQKLYDYYIVQNHTLEETSVYFNVAETTISRYCRFYGISKPKDQRNLRRKIKVNKEELYQYYIIENHSNEETAEYFNIHERTLRRRLREYNIQKTVKLQVECSQKHQIEKYGNLFARSEYYKNNVVSKMVEKGKQTCLKKYGVSSWSMTEDGIKQRKCSYCYDNIKFDSSWELALYIYAVDHKEEIVREPVVLEYYIDNTLHYCVPDFFYKNQLVEIKGEHLIKDGKLNNVYKKSSYKDEAKQKCLTDNNVLIWQHKDVKFAIDYVKEKYGYKYLKQFKIIN